MASRLHILGSGTPTPTAQRFGTAYVVEMDGQFVMIDCGPATTWKLAKLGLSPTKIDTLFFTHHHFDHDVDYPCFLLTRWDQSVGTEGELQVFGPPPTVDLTEKLIGEEGAFSPDYRARMNWPASQRVFVNRGGTLPRPAPRVLAKDIFAGYRHDSAGWSLESTVARHAQPHLDCLAYRLRSEDVEIMFTGDTEPCDSVRALAQGADVMLCMAWDTDSEMLQTGEMAGSCGVGGAARMAAEANVKKLVLVHVGPRVSRSPNREAAVLEAAAVFEGEIVFAEDLMTLDL